MNSHGMGIILVLNQILRVQFLSILKKIIAGAIIDNESPRFAQYPKYQAIELFSDAPDNIKQLADMEALQYLLFEIEGIVLPVATTAFWLDSEGLFIFDDSIDEFWENGGEFIRYLLGPFGELKEYLKDYSDFLQRKQNWRNICTI